MLFYKCATLFKWFQHKNDYQNIFSDNRVLSLHKHCYKAKNSFCNIMINLVTITRSKTDTMVSYYFKSKSTSTFNISDTNM